MNTDKAQSTVIAAMTVAMSMSVLHNATTKSTSMSAGRILIGGVLATTILLGVAGPFPDLAAMFAVLVVTATVLGPPGDSAVKLANRLTKGK